MIPSSLARAIIHCTRSPARVWPREKTWPLWGRGLMWRPGISVLWCRTRKIMAQSITAITALMVPEKLPSKIWRFAPAVQIIWASSVRIRLWWTIASSTARPSTGVIPVQCSLIRPSILQIKIMRSGRIAPRPWNLITAPLIQREKQSMFTRITVQENRTLRFTLTTAPSWIPD